MELGCRSRGIGQRLLAEYVQAGEERLANGGHMVRHRCADKDNVDDLSRERVFEAAR